MTITANNDSKTYGTLKTFSSTAFTETGLVNGDTITGVTETSTGAPASATVGTYNIVPSAATGNRLSNYTIGYVNGTLTVNAALLTITPKTGQSMVYGGAVPVLIYTYTGLVNGDTSATFSGGLATTATSSSSVGGYPITVGTLAATGNYTIGTFNPGTLTVNAAALTITANNDSKTYGTLKTFSGTAFTETGLVTANGDTITGVTETSTGAPASATVGTYNIVPSAATGNRLSNYTIGYVNGTLTVNPATLTITANNDSKTYGTLKTFSSTAFTETGLVNGDTITGVTETSTGAAASATVGTYNIVPSAATGNRLSNYTIGYVNGTLTVNPATLTITANNDSKTYGTLKTFSGTAFTETGLVTANGDTITGVTETSTGAPASATVGTYNIVPSAATGNRLSNYTIGYVNGTLTVNPATLTITANNDSKTYGTLKTFSGTAFTETGLVTANGDTITGVTETSTGAAASATVGTYNIVPSAATGNRLSNYTIGYVNGTLTVNPATLTITANNDSKTYGTLKTFSGTAFTETGLVTANGDTITGVTETSTGAAASATVGTYNIVPSAATGNRLSNYTIGYVNGTLTVNPATLTITANNDSKTYGTLKTFSSTAFTETGLVTANGDTITGVTETSTGAAASATVGTYNIVPSAATGNRLSNYTIGYVNGTLTVNPATLTITANNDSKTYGTLKTFSGTAFTETGLVTANGDTITGVTETSTGAAASATVGTYNIVPSAATGNRLSNYTIGYVNGTLTVNPATLTITANNDSKTYGTLKTFSGTAFTETGLVTANGDTITGVTETSTGAAASATVGTYNIVPSAATGNRLSNYTIGYVNGRLTVNPATLTITANNDSKTYGTLKTFSGTAFTETGLVTANGDTITGVTETSTGAAASATVGTYNIVPSAATGNRLSNYTIGYVNGRLTVNPATLTITANNDSKTYGTLKTFSGTAFTETGLVTANGDTITGVTETSTGAAASATVGTYNIVPSAATGNRLSNYTIGYVNGRLTVNPATLTITANNDSKTYGTLKTFSGTAFTETGLVTANGDTITGVTETSTGAAASATVGTYNIVPSAATGNRLSNYTIGYVNGRLTVNPATLTITANNDSKTYGTLKTFSGTAFTETGLVTANGDTITGVTETSTGAAASATVGTYNIVSSAATGNRLSNYTITYRPGTLLVTPAPLVITANSANKMYGAPLPALSASYTGFVNGDGPASLAVRPALATTASASSPVLPGGYAIMASGARDPDYAISYRPGTLLITPAPLTITANNASMFQGAAVPPLSVSYSGFVNGDSHASLSRQPTVTTPATTHSPAGAYPIVAGGASSPNYAIRYANGVLVINPAPVRVLSVSVQAVRLNRTTSAVILAERSTQGTPRALAITLSQRSPATRRRRARRSHCPRRPTTL